MPNSKEYEEAYKSGIKALREAYSKKESPYLPVLDEINPALSGTTGIDIGYMDIPTAFVAGTKTSARTSSFARNFMPIMAEGTEFERKWVNVCNYHLETGIADPVKVYEYKNRYYVEEGNKRVSVLKYFDAPEVYAHVIRFMPEKNEENAVYFAAADFVDATRINFIELSEAEDYEKLLNLIGYDKDTWSDESCNSFKGAYYSFQKAYATSGIYIQNKTVGDVLLIYMDIFGYDALKEKLPAELQDDIKKIKDEIYLKAKDNPIEVMTHENAPVKESFLQKITAKRISKVAFIHDKSPYYSGWTFSHELGRAHIDEVLGDKIETKSFFFAMDPEPYEAFEEAVKEGFEVIFSTSPTLLNAALRCAAAHPECIVLNCSLNTSHKLIRSYYGRMFEAKFILGALAGVLCVDEKVGYICNYPFQGQIAAVNAFALGVMLTRPNATVYLEWSGEIDGKSAEERLFDKGIELLSTQEIAKTSEGADAKYGLIRRMKDGSLKRLAMPVWDWGKYYEKLIDSINNSSFKSESSLVDKAINYYWGIREEVIDVIISDSLPEGAKRLVLLLKEAFKTGATPFIGPLKMQDGSYISAEDIEEVTLREQLFDEKTLSIEQIIEMDTFLANIEGETSRS